MFAKLKNSKDVRLAAAIAAGIFGGLFFYRLFMWAHEWWTDTEDKSGLIVFALLIGSAVLAFFLVRAFIKRVKRVRTLRAAAAAEAKKQKYVQGILESIHRRARLDAFLEWAQDKDTSLPLLLPEILRNLSPDEVLDMSVDADALRSVCLKTTEQLFDVLAADDWTEWTDDAIVLAAQEILSRQDLPDFVTDLNQFKQSLLLAT